MTVYVVCAIRDRAMDAFMQPVFVPAIGLAVRSFSDEVNRADSPMCNHPEDYDLYEIGAYHDEFGKLVPLENVRMIAVGKDLKRPPTAMA